jgi:hypothetical protein
VGVGVVVLVLVLIILAKPGADSGSSGGWLDVTVV